MKGELIEVDGTPILVITADGEPLASRTAALDLIALAMEHGANHMLLDEGSLAPEFTQLANGIAGETLQKLVNYRIVGAAVLPLEVWSSGRFGELALEMNKGNEFRIFSDRNAALHWLSRA